MTATRTPTSPLGVRMFEPRVYRDDRGDFRELYRTDRYAEAGLAVTFVQDNMSRSRKNVLRGMHLQHPRSQGKLIAVLAGEILDVVVDLRVGSPTFARWSSFQLSAENARQIYVPPGMAHGFLALSDEAVVLYRCTEFYSPADELTLLWNDPQVGIEWPISEPILSAKDASGLALRDIPLERLPKFDAAGE